MSSILQQEIASKLLEFNDGEVKDVRDFNCPNCNFLQVYWLFNIESVFFIQCDQCEKAFVFMFDTETLYDQYEYKPNFYLSYRGRFTKFLDLNIIWQKNNFI